MLTGHPPPASAQSLTAPYSPSRGEWLKVALHTDIIEQTALWEARVAVVVAVDERNNSVVLTVTLANGQREPTNDLRDRYVQAVTGIARNILARYTWARDVKLTVQFA